ncbi:MAG: sulfite exporter TauE/SafE family protein [Rubrivivax sp.]
MIVLDTLLAAAGSAAALVAYLACVALATTAQTLTGFAFGLIFLSLMAALDLASVADAANVATVLTLVNALTYLRAHRQAPPWRLMKPALASSSVGVVAGLALLNWFSTTAAQALKGLLGLPSWHARWRSSLAAACVPTVAPPRSFALAGAVSGLMGGRSGRPARPSCTTSIASRSRPRWCAAACC